MQSLSSKKECGGYSQTISIFSGDKIYVTFLVNNPSDSLVCLFYGPNDRILTKPLSDEACPTRPIGLSYSQQTMGCVAPQETGNWKITVASVIHTSAYAWKYFTIFSTEPSNPVTGYFLIQGLIKSLIALDLRNTEWDLRKIPGIFSCSLTRPGILTEFGFLLCLIDNSEEPLKPVLQSLDGRYFYIPLNSELVYFSNPEYVTCAWPTFIPSVPVLSAPSQRAELIEIILLTFRIPDHSIEFSAICARGLEFVAPLAVEQKKSAQIFPAPVLTKVDPSVISNAELTRVSVEGFGFIDASDLACTIHPEPLYPPVTVFLSSTELICILNLSTNSAIDISQFQQKSTNTLLINVTASLPKPDDPVLALSGIEDIFLVEPAKGQRATVTVFGNFEDFFNLRWSFVCGFSDGTVVPGYSSSTRLTCELPRQGLSPLSPAFRVSAIDSHTGASRLPWSASLAIPLYPTFQLNRIVPGPWMNGQGLVSVEGRNFPPGEIFCDNIPALRINSRNILCAPPDGNTLKVSWQGRFASLPNFIFPDVQTDSLTISPSGRVSISLLKPIPPGQVTLSLLVNDTTTIKGFPVTLENRNILSFSAPAICQPCEASLIWENTGILTSLGSFTGTFWFDEVPTREIKWPISKKDEQKSPQSSTTISHDKPPTYRVYGNFDFEVFEGGQCWLAIGGPYYPVIAATEKYIDCMMSEPANVSSLQIYVSAVSDPQHFYFPGVLLSAIPMNCLTDFEAPDCVPFASKYENALNEKTQLLPMLHFFHALPGTVINSALVKSNQPLLDFVLIWGLIRSLHQYFKLNQKRKALLFRLLSYQTGAW